MKAGVRTGAERVSFLFHKQLRGRNIHGGGVSLKVGKGARDRASLPGKGMRRAFSPCLVGAVSWGVAPGWYEGAPLALGRVGVRELVGLPEHHSWHANITRFSQGSTPTAVGAGSPRFDRKRFAPTNVRRLQIEGGRGGVLRELCLLPECLRGLSGASRIGMGVRGIASLPGLRFAPTDVRRLQLRESVLLGCRCFLQLGEGVVAAFEEVGVFRVAVGEPVQVEDGGVPRAGLFADVGFFGVPGHDLIRFDGELLRVFAVQFGPRLGQGRRRDGDEAAGVIDAAAGNELGELGDLFHGAGIWSNVPEACGAVRTGGEERAAVLREGGVVHAVPVHEGRGDGCAGEGIPDARGVIPTGGHDSCAVRAEGRGDDPAIVLQERGDGIAGGGVPDAGGVVRAGGDNVTAIRAEGREREFGGVLQGRGEGLAGLGIPDACGVIPTGSDDLGAIRTERGEHDAVAVFQGRCDGFARGGVPHAGGVVPARGDDAGAVCIELRVGDAAFVLDGFAIGRIATRRAVFTFRSILSLGVVIPLRSIVTFGEIRTFAVFWAILAFATFEACARAQALIGLGDVGFVIVIGGEKHGAVRAEGGEADGLGNLEAATFLAGLGIPRVDHLVFRDGIDAGAGKETRGENLRITTEDGRDGIAADDIPDAHGLIRDGEHLAVVLREDGLLELAFEREFARVLLRRRSIPDAHGAVLADDHDAAAIRIEQRVQNLGAVRQGWCEGLAGEGVPDARGFFRYGQYAASIRREARTSDARTVRERGRQRLTREGIPNAAGIVFVRRDDTQAVRAELGIRHRAVVLHGRGEWFAFRGIPDARGEIRTGGDDFAAIWTESDVADEVAMLHRAGDALTGLRVPHGGGLVLRGGGEAGAVRAEGDVIDLIGTHDGRTDGFARLGVPDADETFASFATGDGDVFAITAEGGVVYRREMLELDGVFFVRAPIPKERGAVVIQQHDLLTIRAQGSGLHRMRQGDGFADGFAGGDVPQTDALLREGGEEAAVAAGGGSDDGRLFRPKLDEARGLPQGRGDARALELFALRAAIVELQGIHETEQRSGGITFIEEALAITDVQAYEALAALLGERFRFLLLLRGGLFLVEREIAFLLQPLLVHQDDADKGREADEGRDGEQGDGRAAGGPFAGAIKVTAGAGLDGFLAEPAFQVFGNGFGGTVAPLRIFLHALEADGFEIAVDAAVNGRGALRFVIDDEAQGLQRRIRAERGLAGEQLVKDSAEAIDIDSRRELNAFALGLLGRHVVRRADDLTSDRDVLTSIDTLREAEVRDVRFALGIEQDVIRLHVAMQNAVLMGEVDGARDLRHQDGASMGVRVVADHVFIEAATLDVTHAEEQLAIEITDLVDGDDVGVIEIRDGFRFRAETLHLVFTGETSGENGLQGDGAVQLDLARLVDGAHAALGDAFEQFVITEQAGLVAFDASLFHGLLHLGDVELDSGLRRAARRGHGIARGSLRRLRYVLLVFIAHDRFGSHCMNCCSQRQQKGRSFADIYSSVSNSKTLKKAESCEKNAK